MKRISILPFTFITAATLLLLYGCGEHMDIPESLTGSEADFGANDTTFVRVSPDWAGAPFNFRQPTDIQIGRDKSIFVLDYSDVVGHTNGRVSRIALDGEVFEDDLFADAMDTVSSPALGIGQDSKLNVFLVNGTEKVFAWNQYNQQHSPILLAQTITLRGTQDGSLYVIDNTQKIWEALEEQGLTGSPFVIEDLQGTDDPDSIAAHMGTYVFYSDTTRAGSQLTDVDSNVDQSETVYVSDRNTDRVFSLATVPCRMLIFSDSTFGYTYEGIYQDLIVAFGQGQGSTNNPTSLTTEGLGGRTGLFFTQVSGNFLVQRMSGSGDQFVFDFGSATS
ncbi:hypothetical protein GF324_12490, partial [bacterium]|nr:hypothetical protein [bacterium]